MKDGTADGDQSTSGGSHPFVDSHAPWLRTVSTADQNPAHQIGALTRAGVAEDDIYLDRSSGAKASRPQLDELL